jgi:hypothetical protein
MDASCPICSSGNVVTITFSFLLLSFLGPIIICSLLCNNYNIHRQPDWGKNRKSKIKKNEESRTMRETVWLLRAQVQPSLSVNPAPTSPVSPPGTPPPNTPAKSSCGASAPCLGASGVSRRRRLSMPALDGNVGNISLGFGRGSSRK